jgi:hypothetical protein
MPSPEHGYVFCGQRLNGRSSFGRVQSSQLRLLALMESANKVPFCSSGYDALDIGRVVPVGRGGRAGAKRCD